MMRFAAVLLILASLPAAAQFRGPHYVSQRASKAFMREGPTYQHKVLWEFRRKGYPFQVIAAYDTWRRVKAPDGSVGWMAASMLTELRSVLVIGKGRAKLYDKPDGTKLVALADPGALGALLACTRDVCRIKGESVDGWIAKDRLWGVDRGEVFEKLRRR